MSHVTMGDEIHALRTALARIEAERDALAAQLDRPRIALIKKNQELQEQCSALSVEAAEYKQDGEQWKAAHDELAGRERALAAHVEEIRRVRSIPRSEFEHDGRRVQLLIEAIDKAHATSLAHVKAQWQAEALGLVRSTMRAHGLTEEEGLVNTLSQALSRQSEKMNSWPASTNDDGACGRIKARWQIEALESVRKAAMNGDGCVSLDILLIDRINRLRRHAEEGESHDD